MPRLTKIEKKQHSFWLSGWPSPDAVLEYCEKLMQEMASDTAGISSALFNQAGVDFITEAYAAALFAKLRGLMGVRLCLDDQPDFQLLVEGKVQNWELTEADVEGRERGREYLESAAKAMAGEEVVEDDPVEDWIARADQASRVLQKRATEKSKKTYPPETRLLIYLNIGEYGIRQGEIEGCMHDATSPAKDVFAEVWVLWKGKAYKLWEGGRASHFSKAWES